MGRPSGEGGDLTAPARRIVAYCPDDGSPVTVLDIFYIVPKRPWWKRLLWAQSRVQMRCPVCHGPFFVHPNESALALCLLREEHR